MHAAPLLPILDPLIGWWNQLWVYEPVWEQQKISFLHWCSADTDLNAHRSLSKDASSCPGTNVHNCFTSVRAYHKNHNRDVFSVTYL